MSIYITGDLHGQFNRFSMTNFPEQKELTKNDFVIVCGDFGIWDDTKEEKYWLDWLAKKSFTLLFVDGNHENFDRLNFSFPVVDFFGGKAHKIRDNVYHLMRGYIFNICGKKIFAFGGASSQDIKDGILDETDYSDKAAMMRDYQRRTRKGELLRINHISWWKEEMPSIEEMEIGRDNLRSNDYKVDLVVSHCPPAEIYRYFGYYDIDMLLSYFDMLLICGLDFKEWWSGHLHKDKYGIYGKYNVIFHDIKRVV